MVHRFLYLKMGITFLSVCAVHLKRGVHTVGAQNVKKKLYDKVESRFIDGPLSDQTETRSNPQGKKLGQYDLGRISANLKIWCHDKNH